MTLTLSDSLERIITNSNSSHADHLQRTNKRNPCNDCGDTSSKCAYKDNQEEFSLCAGTPSARNGDIVNGRKCIEDNAKGHTTHIWILDKGDFAVEEWEKRKIERELEEKRKLLERNKKSLSSDIRHQHYEPIFNCLELNQTTVLDLEQRGFTQIEIDNCGFKSVVKDQKIPLQVPDDLPGVGKYGFSLIVADDGFLCPVKDPQGRITGWQLRIYKVEKGNKYRWGNDSSRQVLGLPVDGGVENPLAVFRPQVETKGIGLCEGTGPKPYLASSRLNLIIIGASGGQFASSPKLLEQYLHDVSQELGGTKELTIFPDAGDIINKNVIKRWKNLCELLTKLGYTYKFAWWGQTTKEHLDIDELNDFSQIQYISGSEFFTIAELGTKNAETKKLVELPNKPLNEEKIRVQETKNIHNQNLQGEQKAANLSKKNKSSKNAAGSVTERPKQWDRWIKSRQFTPTITINQPELTDFDIPTRNAIIAIKSAMGTGKTRWLIKTIKNSPNRAFLLGCLNNLLYQTISVAGKEFNTQIYHLYLDDADSLVADKDTYIACCVDSMQHLDGYFKGVDLYIDEICSVIASILSGGTLGERQAYIMKIFEKAVREANRIFILDANLSDIITDFIAKIDPTKAVVKVLNIAKPRPHHFKFVDGFNPDKNTINSRDKSPVIKAIRNSEKPFIASDSRKFINSISEVLNSEGKKGHGLSRDTVNEDWAKSFLNNPNEFLTSPLNYFGISPSANSGVSITDPCGFTDKISVFTGVLATNQQSQILMRLRPVLNHLIYCPEFSTIQTNKIKAKTPYSYYNQVFEKITLSAELASDGSEPIAEILSNAFKKYKDDIWLDLSCELGSLDNFERDNLRQCLIYALEEQGHTTEIISLETSKEDAQKLADANESLLKQQADETFKAEPLEDIEEANELAKTSPKPEMMRRIEKTRLLDRLPGIDLTAIWDADFIYSTLKDQDFINKHSRFWMLNNVDISRKRLELKWYYGATGEYFYLGGMVRDAHLKIWALDQLNILQFADGRQYNKDSLEVIEFYNKALNDKKINTALGETIHPETVTGKERIELLRKCMASVGLKLKFDGQKIINGTKQRLYSLDIEAFNDPIRLEIVNAVERKYSGYLSSEAVKKIDWTNHITPKTEEINQVPQFDDIFAAAEFIRELISGNAGWGFVQMHFAKFDEVSKKRIFQQLTVEEQTILKSLKPIDEEEIKAKELITIIKSGKDIQARCDRALEGVENRQNLVYYLHPSYHYLLFPKSQDLVA